MLCIYLTEYYSMCRRGDRLEIKARYPAAKEAIIGWGGDFSSTRDPGAIELYGSEEGVGEPVDDYSPWVWSLTPAGVASLRRGAELSLNERERFETTDEEASLYRELLTGLEALAD